VAFNGLFTLAKFVSKTVSNSDKRQSLSVLTLATLGGMTKKRNVLICVALPKVAKASTIVSVVCRCCWHYQAKTLPM
jgi:hypothetical protein